MKFRLTSYLVLISTVLHCQTIEVLHKNTNKNAQRAEEQVERIIKEYDSRISKWFFTETVQIDCESIPHSHPILTLNCNYLDNDLKQLANFLHEQFHWFMTQRTTQEAQAITELKQLFPDIPVSGKEGARDEYSGYLHLIVCDLEFQAMSEILGEDTARQLLGEWVHYTWIYNKVLSDRRIRQINIKYGFVVPK